jgi:hypothetical protein
VRPAGTRAVCSGRHASQARDATVALQQTVRSSRAYDWDHPSLLWCEYLEVEDWIPWRLHPPRKRLQWEIDGVARLWQLGSPAFLGYGFGEGQAELSGEVEFGARFVLQPSTTLDEVTDVLKCVE